MFCKNCGTQNEEGANFCKSCGSWMGKEPAETVADITEEKPAEVPAPEAKTENGQQDRSMYQYNYNPGDSDATVSLVMGIVSILMCSSSLIGIGLGIAAIVMAGKAKKRGSVSGNATAGSICGIVGICLGAICTLYYLIAFFAGILGALANF